MGIGQVIAWPLAYFQEQHTNVGGIVSIISEGVSPEQRDSQLVWPQALKQHLTPKIFNVFQWVSNTLNLKGSSRTGRETSKITFGCVVESHPSLSKTDKCFPLGMKVGLILIHLQFGISESAPAWPSPILLSGTSLCSPLPP